MQSVFFQSTLCRHSAPQYPECWSAMASVLYQDQGNFMGSQIIAFSLEVQTHDLYKKKRGT